jgi:hypothetical protein
MSWKRRGVKAGSYLLDVVASGRVDFGGTMGKINVKDYCSLVQMLTRKQRGWVSWKVNSV